MDHRRLVCIVLLLFGLSGCQPWQTMKEIYRGTIFPADVDVGGKANVGEDIRSLARKITSVDAQLEELIRSAKRLDNPSPSELQDVLSKFSWLNGGAVFDASGQLQHQVPAQPIKDISEIALKDGLFDPLTEISLRVMDMDLGPEMCLIRPIRDGDQVIAYAVLHFDPRSLFGQFPDPQDLVVMYRDTVIWSRMGAQTETKIQEMNWTQKLQDKVQGELTVHEDSFVWLARYVGERPLVYLIRKGDTDGDGQGA